MCNLLGKWSLYDKFSVEQGLFTRGSIILKLGTNFIRYRFSSQMLDYDHVGFQFPSSIIPPKIFRLPPPSRPQAYIVPLSHTSSRLEGACHVNVPKIYESRTDLNDILRGSLLLILVSIISHDIHSVTVHK